MIDLDDLYEKEQDQLYDDYLAGVYTYDEYLEAYEQIKVEYTDYTRK